MGQKTYKGRGLREIVKHMSDKRKRALALVGAGLTLVSVLGGYYKRSNSDEDPGKAESAETSVAENEDKENSQVYASGNGYDDELNQENAEYEVTSTLEVGDIIEYNSELTTYYKESTSMPGYWIKSDEPQNENDIKWCYCVKRSGISSNMDRVGYVNSSKVQEFCRYKIKGAAAFYKTSPEDKDVKFVAYNSKCEIYADDKEEYICSDGRILKKAIIREQEYDDEVLSRTTYKVVYAYADKIEKYDDKNKLGYMKERDIIKDIPVDDIEHEIDSLEGINIKKDETGLKYLIDISVYEDWRFDDYVKVVEDLNSKGLLGGVIMEIARNKGDSFSIKHIRNNDAIDSLCSRINASYNREVAQGVLSDYEALKKYVQYTVDICPVGLYAFFDAVKPQDIISMCSVVSKTQEELLKDVVGLKENMLPFMYDIEQNKMESDRYKTTVAAAETIKLLGHGSQNYKFWGPHLSQTDTVNEGFGVIDKNFILYTPAAHISPNANHQESGGIITNIKDLENLCPEYTAFKLAACYVDKDIDFNSYACQNCFNGEGLINSMNKGLFTDIKQMAYYSIMNSDAIQYMGNVNMQAKDVNRRQVFDFSVCTAERLRELLDGTLEKERKCNFIEDIKVAVAENKEHSKAEYGNDEPSLD